MRVLCATTANHGHFGPLLPFARALAKEGHEVRVAAPASFAGAVTAAGFVHEPFADAPREVLEPVMGRLPTLGFEEADDLVIREVFARIDAQAALPSLMATVRRWRPDLVLRETAELASFAAAPARWRSPEPPAPGSGPAQTPKPTASAPRPDRPAARAPPKDRR